MEMKNIYSILLVMALLFTVSSIASAQPALSIGNKSAPPMERVQLPVLLQTEGNNLTTVLMDIRYDAANLKNPSVAIGSAAEGKTLLTSTLPSGALRITLYDLHNTPLHDGALVTISFTVESKAEKGTLSDVTFDPKTVGASDPAGNDIAMTGNGGFVAVQ